MKVKNGNSKYSMLNVYLQYLNIVKWFTSRYQIIFTLQYEPTLLMIQKFKTYTCNNKFHNLLLPTL